MAQSNTERSRRFRARIKARLASLEPPAKPAPSELELAAFDPVRVLKTIALDTSAPTGPRVAAAKALLLLQPSRPSDRPMTPADRLLHATIAQLGRGN